MMDMPLQPKLIPSIEDRAASPILGHPERLATERPKAIGLLLSSDEGLPAELTISPRHDLAGNDGCSMDRYRLQDALMSGGVGAWEVDVDRRLVSVTDLCATHLGAGGVARFMNLGDVLAAIHLEDRTRTMDVWRQALEGDSALDTSFRCNRPEGTIRWIRLRGRAISGRSSWSGVSFDITAERRVQLDRAHSEAALLHLANHDPLTGLPNRRILARTLEKALASASPTSQVALLSLSTLIASRPSTTTTATAQETTFWSRSPAACDPACASRIS